MREMHQTVINRCCLHPARCSGHPGRHGSNTRPVPHNSRTTPAQRSVNRVWPLLALTALLLVTAGYAPAAVRYQLLSIKGTKMPLAQVFQQIKKQAGYEFFYNSRLMEKTHPVTINVTNAPISRVMDLCCEGQGLTYRIVDRTIILDEQKTPDEKTIAVTIPPVVVKGKVVNKNKEPLIGVTITIVGKAAGTTTGVDGSFTINAATGDVLQFSYLGYEPKKVTVTGAGALGLVLLADAYNALQEAVVIAYGTTTARSNTGSIAKVKGDDIARLPVQSFESTLSGRATGVNMVANAGVINQAPVFRIRGTNSLSLSSYPLIVIDGVPAYTDDTNVGGNASNNPLSAINPADIESIDIAKDAAATSLYGSRAANGVVFVTTKKGKLGRAKLSLNTSFGYSQAVRLADVLNAEQYLEIKNEGLVNAGTYDAQKNYYGYSVGPDGDTVRTNWFDYLFRKGFTQNHTLSISGATETTRYYGSVGYTKQNGILKGNNYYRKSVSFNIEHKFASWLSVGNRTNYANDLTGSQLSTGNGASSSAANSVAYRMALISAPIIGPYNKDGSYNVTGLNLGLMDNQGHLTSSARMGYTNPVITLAFNKDNTGNNFIQSNSFVQLMPVKGLTLRTVYGVDNMYSRTERYFDPRSMEGYNDKGSATSVSAKREKWVWTNTADMKFSLGSHNMNVLVGEEEQKFTGNMFGVKRYGQTDPYYSDIQGGYTSIQLTNTQDERYYQYLQSFFSRLLYDYKNKYQFSASIRRDRSSLLGKNNKAGLFWGFSGGWEISEESFWKESGLGKKVEYLKLKASYGKVGNLAGIGDYQTLSTYAATLYGGQSGLYYSAAGNPDLKWETSKKTDVGIVFGLFNSRLNGEIAFYNNNIDGLIFGVPVPASVGIPGSTPNSILSNVGKMYNRGWEFSINGVIADHKSFGWNAGINLSLNKNEITELAPNVDRLLLAGFNGSTDMASISMVGHPVGMIYAIRTAGVDPATGRRIFLDKDGNKVLYTQVAAAGRHNWEYEDGKEAPAITTSVDGVAYTNTNPKLYGGLSNHFRYKQFDLDMLFTYQLGGHVYYGTQGTLMDGRFANNSTKILRRWQKAGDVTDVPRLMDGDYTSWGYSMPISANVYSSNYLRMKNISLGYTISPRVLQTIHLENVRVYVSAQNLFLVTPYPGADPEVTSNGNVSATQGFDRNMTPNARIITGGLQVTF